MALTPAEVTHLYESILFRAPNTHELTAGQNNTEAALTDSLIHTSANQVLPFILIYQAAFNRIPDAVGLNEGLGFWVNTYRNGSLNIWDYTAQIVETPEFDLVFDALPTPDAVNQIYLFALGRNAEKSGLDFWVELISTGKKTLTDVLFDISQSDESLARNQAAAENLQRAVAAEDADFDGQGPLIDWAPVAPPPAGELTNLTVAADTVVLGVNDTVKGFSDSTQDNGNRDTYNGNDSITGTVGGNNKFELSVNGNVTQQGSVRNVDLVAVEAGSVNTALRVSNWTGIKTLELNQVKADFHLDDIQEGKTQINIADKTQNAHTVTLSYDSTEFGGEANIGVHETFATVVANTTDIQSGAVKTINLTINDTQGRASTLAALQGHKTEKLTIKNGEGSFAAGNFKIIDALDGSLKEIDASTATSNLDLNISRAGRNTLDVKLGSGNDKLATGDTLRGNVAKTNNDVIDGGAGEDTLTAVFTTGGTRNPIVTNIETFNLTFNASAVLDFRYVDDVRTVEINPSSAEFRLHNLDSDVSLLKVKGAQNSATHHIYYAGDATDSNLKVEWTSPSSKDNGAWNSSKSIWEGDAGRIDVRNAGEFHFSYAGEFTTFFTDHQDDSTDDAWQFDVHLTNAVTRVLSVENTGKGDLVLIQEDAPGYHAYDLNPLPRWPVNLMGEGGSSDCGCYCGYYLREYADIGGTNAVTDLSFATKDTGDIWLRDVRNVNVLETLDVAALGGGSILIDNIGFSASVWDDDSGHDNPSGFNAARFLQTVDISAAQRAIANVNYLNGVHQTSSQTNSNGNTVSAINIHAAAGSEANLWKVSLGDVNTTTIQTDRGATVGVCEWELVNNTSSGKNLGTLTVSGAGVLNEQGFASQIGSDTAYDGNGQNYWVFTNQTIKTQDYSGLTHDTARIDFRYDTAGATVIGTDTNLASAQKVGFYNIEVKGDSFLGSKGADIINAGGGDDFVYAGANSTGGRNLIDLGAGADYGVTADAGKTTFTTGKGNDIIIVTSVGQERTGQVDVSNNLVTDFHYEGQDKLWLDLDKIDDGLDAFFKTNVKLIEGNGNQLDAGDPTKFQTINDGNPFIVAGSTTVIDIRGAEFSNLDDLQGQLQFGGTHQLSTQGRGNRWDIDDAILVTWQDATDDGVLHVSALRVEQVFQHGSGSNAYYTYNFEGVDLIGLQGTNAINQVDIDFI